MDKDSYIKQLESKISNLENRLSEITNSLPPEVLVGTSLRDLIDMSKYQFLLESLSQIWHVCLAVLDNHGNTLCSYGWQDVCFNFHRKGVLSSANCTQSDRYIFSHSSGLAECNYRCINGLRDVAIPIYIGGKQLAALYLGQFLMDNDEIDDQANVQRIRENNFDANAYLTALSAVRRVSEGELGKMIAVLRDLTYWIAELGQKQLTLASDSLRKESDLKEKLQIQELLFVSVVEKMPLALKITDTEGDVILKNSQYKNLYESPNYSDLVCKLQKPSRYMDIEGVVDEELEFENVDNQNQHRYFRRISYPIQTATGDSLNVQLTSDISLIKNQARDLLAKEGLIIEKNAALEHSNRQLLESNATLHLLNTTLDSRLSVLKEREQHFETTFQSDGVIRLIINPENQTVVDANAKALEFYGYTIDEFRGLKLNVINSELNDQVGGYIRGVLDHTLRYFRTCHLAKGKVNKWVSVYPSIIHTQGQQLITATIIDETARIEAENKVLKSEARYRNLIDTLPGVSYNYSLKYGASFWSPQVEGILGFAQDAFVENPFLWAESIHPDDKNVVSQALIGDAPADWIVEYRIYRADGKLIWLSDQFLAKRTELDNIYVEGYATDITMRKVAEQNLFEKERKYKTLYNSSPVMLMSLSDEMRIVSANAFWLSKMKYNYQEVIGRSFSEFVLPQCRTQLTMYWNSLWNEVEVENTELQLQDSSGEIIEVKAFASKEKVSGNSSYNVVAYLLDVTQQKIATKALKNSEIKYHALMSVMREGLVLISQDGEILFANSAANLLLGLRTGDLWEEQNSDPTRKIIHPDGHIFDLKDYPAFLTLETGEAYQNIVMGIENIGKAIAWIRLNTEPIYHENNTLPSEVLVSFSDITELVEQEQRLRQLNQTKDKFFSIVAHDLRSPFNSIFGMVQLIKTRVEVNDYESISKYLNYLEESSNKFFNLLNNLLDWSRIQLNRFEFRSSIFSFEELVIDTIEQFAVNISNKNLEVVYAGEPKLKIAADKNMIASVLRNLLSNAIKFSHKGKKIHIYFGLNNSEVEFSVRDEGVGMDAQTLGQLFDDSRSASTLGTNSEHGTGLGLQLCKDFISKHNGRIRVESTLGLGSVFYCNFPNSK